jgi:hypothetical protein
VQERIELGTIYIKISCYGSRKWESERDKYVSRSEATRCLKYHQSYEHESDNSLIYDITRFCTITSVAQHRYAISCQVWKGIMCQKVSGTTIMVHISWLQWLNIQNKQTAVKTQESTISPEANIPQRWKQQKPELMTVLHKNYHLLDSTREWNVSFMHVLVKKTLRTIWNNCTLNGSWQGTMFIHEQ